VKPNFASANLQPHSPGFDPANCFSVQKQSRFPQDPAHGLVVAFADLENVLGVHQLRCANCVYHKPPFGGSFSADFFKEERDARVSEHIWILTIASGIDAGIGQHEVEQTADPAFGIVDGEPDAGAQRVRGENLAGHAAHAAIRHTYYDFGQALPRSAGLR
jgi:hypothetical protein